MRGFTLIDFSILIMYLLIVLLIGLYVSKKDMEGKEYFKGNGKIPWYVTSVSIFATLLSPYHFYHFQETLLAVTLAYGSPSSGYLSQYPLQ